MADGENISTSGPQTKMGQTGFGGSEAPRTGASFTPRGPSPAADLTQPSSPKTERGERRYSFNMLVATAVVGYAIGRLLPR